MFMKFCIYLYTRGKRKAVMTEKNCTFCRLLFIVKLQKIEYFLGFKYIKYITYYDSSSSGKLVKFKYQLKRNFTRRNVTL